MYYRYIGFIKLNYNRYIDYILIQSYPSIASSRFLVTPGPRGFGPAAGWGSLDVQMAFLGEILWGFIVVWCFFSIRPKLDLLEFLDIFGSVSWITKGEPPKKGHGHRLGWHGELFRAGGAWASQERAAGMAWWDLPWNPWKMMIEHDFTAENAWFSVQRDSTLQI